MTFHPQRLILVGLCLVGIVGSLLPWASAPVVGDIAGTERGGWITLGIFVATIVLTVATGPSGRVGRGVAMGVALLGLGAGGYAGWTVYAAYQNMRDTVGDGLISRVAERVFELGAGIYVTIGAAMVLTVTACWFLAMSRAEPR